MEGDRFIERVDSFDAHAAFTTGLRARSTIRLRHVESVAQPSGMSITASCRSRRRRSMPFAAAEEGARYPATRRARGPRRARRSAALRKVSIVQPLVRLPREVLTAPDLVANLGAPVPELRSALVDAGGRSAELDVAVEPDRRAEVEQRAHDIFRLECRYPQAMLVLRTAIAPRTQRKLEQPRNHVSALACFPSRRSVERRVPARPLHRRAQVRDPAGARSRQLARDALDGRDSRHRARSRNLSDRHRSLRAAVEATPAARSLARASRCHPNGALRGFDKPNLSRRASALHRRHHRRPHERRKRSWLPSRLRRVRRATFTRTP